MLEKYFVERAPGQIHENAIKIVGLDSMLITAGKKDHFNTMTAGWGGLGFLWKKPVAFIFIRPQRYTYEFVEKNEDFTLCFFEPKYDSILDYCGNHSGRDTDKMKVTGLTPLETERGNIVYSQARLVLECKKWYYDDIDPEHFVDPNIKKMYPINDFHRMYFGEILYCGEKIVIRPT